MAKHEDIINMEGRVEEVLPATMFRIKLDNVESLVLAHLSGRMRKNNIKVLLGDRVEMEISPYDLTTFQCDVSWNVYDLPVPSSWYKHATEFRLNIRC